MLSLYLFIVLGRYDTGTYFMTVLYELSFDSVNCAVDSNVFI